MGFSVNGGFAELASSGTGTTGKLVLFSDGAAGAIGNSALTDSGSIVTSTENVTISNTAPSLVFTDTTASAKGLTILADANKAQFRESAGAAGSLLVLDLSNNRVGIATASPSVALDVTGAFALSGDATLAGDVILSGAAKKVDLSAVSAGNPVFKITATSDTPSTTYTAHVASTDPAGYIEILVGASARYIPFFS